MLPYFFSSFMHVSPGWIHSTFEYLSRKSPTMLDRDRLASICCDEMFIDPNTDIDLILDTALNETNSKNAHIFMVRSICGKWKFPFFCDVNKTFTKEDIKEAILRFEVAGIKIVSLTCDEGTVNSFSMQYNTTLCLFFRCFYNIFLYQNGCEFLVCIFLRWSCKKELNQNIYHTCNNC